jgi:hypothetical protein
LSAHALEERVRGLYALESDRLGERVRGLCLAHALESP